MSLNQHHHFSAADAAAAVATSPDAKLTFNINAFNGNTTNFNRQPRPCAKSMIRLPSQPRDSPVDITMRPGLIVPM